LAVELSEDAGTDDRERLIGIDGTKACSVRR
jgi:hypothetical protein